MTRKLVAEVLVSLGYTPVYQGVQTAAGDLRQDLREKIDCCEGLIQIVGDGYGYEPPTDDEIYGRVSYTHFEFLYARDKGKKIWLIFPDKNCERDTPPDDLDRPADLKCADPKAYQEERRRLQEKYTIDRRSDGYVYHLVSSNADLKVKIAQINNELAALREGERIWKRNVRRAFVIVIILLLLTLSMFAWRFTYDWHQSFDKWVHDDFVGVRVVERAVGTLLNEDAYELQLEVRNETTIPLIINNIKVASLNQKAARLLGRSDPQVFEADIRITYHLKANEVKNIPVTLNQILPKTIEVLVKHNLAGEPSQFSIDLKAQALPMPPPRYLPRESIFRGFNSMTALTRATAEARSWSSDACLISMFPGDQKVYLDDETLLKMSVVESWVTTFYSHKEGRIFMAVVSPAEVKGQAIDAKQTLESLPIHGISAPKMGVEKAIDIANRASLISADWRGLNLGTLSFGNEMIYAWHIPYRAPDGMPIMIDAVTGDRIEHNYKNGFQRKSLKTAPIHEPQGD